jgi:hypothetical protein
VVLVYTRVDRELFPTDELARLFFGTEREAYAPEVLGVGTGTPRRGGEGRREGDAAGEGPGRLRPCASR